MQKILVIGGAGFIGSHLVENLLEDKNNKVEVVDDFSEGKLSNLPTSKRLKVHQISILSSAFGKGEEFSNVDIAYHLAALTRPRWSIKYPSKANRVNVSGTLRVLDWCVKKKVGKLVATSSASAYGSQEKLLLREDLDLNPVSPYALTKKINEMYCRIYSELYGLKYDILRPFNVFGPRQNLYGGYSAAIPNFIHHLKNGGTPYITGDGKQKRDFIYVKDVASLMSLLGKRQGHGEVFNAGSGKSVSINSLYKKICKLMDVKVKPNYLDEIKEPETKADIKKAKNLLGWEPKYSLDEGLKETIKALVQ